jgi:lysozyme
MKKLIRTVLLLAVLAGVGFWGYNAVVNREININKWFLSGQSMGVDVSSYQIGVDFDVLKKQGIEFAYIKATEGSTHVDSSFKEKWAAALEAGVPVGAYHYFIYTVSGAEQAENFIKTVGELDNERLIPAVDMELTMAEVQNPPAVEDVVRGLKAFLAVVEEKYGVKPLIYAQKDYYDKYLAADFASYPRWARNVFYPVFIDIGNEWTVWQYNDKGELNGYSGEKYIDMNVVNSAVGVEGLKYKK